MVLPSIFIPPVALPLSLWPYLKMLLLSNLLVKTYLSLIISGVDSHRAANLCLQLCIFFPFSNSSFYLNKTADYGLRLYLNKTNTSQKSETEK